MDQLVLYRPPALEESAGSSTFEKLRQNVAGGNAVLTDAVGAVGYQGAPRRRTET